MTDRTRSRLTGWATSAVLAAGIAWYLLGPGGQIRKQQAIEKVRSYQITLNTSVGGSPSFDGGRVTMPCTTEHTIDSLIENYDSNTGVLRGGASATLNEVLSEHEWQASYCGGKFVVGRTVRGQLYSFETDMINVTPISNAAQQLCSLAQAAFR